MRKTKPPARLNGYKHGARVRGIEWLLTDAQALDLFEQPCYYCGGEAGGIDRLNNEKFYTPANAVPCCQPCNFAKQKMKAIEYTMHCAAVVAHIAGRTDAFLLDYLRRTLITSSASRGVLQLHSFGLTVREIAKQLGLSVSKVQRIKEKYHLTGPRNVVK